MANACCDGLYMLPAAGSVAVDGVQSSVALGRGDHLLISSTTPFGLGGRAGAVPDLLSHPRIVSTSIVVTCVIRAISCFRHSSRCSEHNLPRS